MRPNLFVVLREDGELGAIETPDGVLALVTCEMKTAQDVFADYLEDNPEWRLFMYRNPIDITEAVRNFPFTDKRLDPEELN